MNKRGSTLIMTIFLVMLMSVLTLALFIIAVTDKKQVVQQDDQMQSYYVARSGADAVAEFIILNPLEINTLDGHTSDAYTIGNGSVVVTPTITSEHADGTASEVHLLSVGSVENRTKTVELILETVNLDHAIFCEDDLDVSGLDVVEGDLGSNGSITVGDCDRGVDDEEEEYMNINIPSWGAPSVNPFTSDLTWNDDYTFDANIEEADAILTFLKPSIHGMITPELRSTTDVLASDVPDIEAADFYTKTDTGIDNLAVIAEYDRIRLNMPADTKELVFDTTLGDILIIVDDLELKGTIRAIGTGKVIFYVKNIGDVYTPNQYGFSDDPDRLLFYLAPGVKFTFQTPGTMYGRIIGPEANVYMSSGNLYGSIVAGSFEGKGNGEVHYVDSSYEYLVTGFVRSEWK